MTEVFSANEYLIRRKVFTIFGAKFHIYDPEGRVIGFSKQKAFKLKEDIRVFGDETLSDERLLIKARQIIDFSAAYDVVDSPTGAKLGALRRKGLGSLLRDSWEFLDESDRSIGTIREDSAGWALFRRFIFNLIPQTFHAEARGRQVATYRVQFNPFVYRLNVTIDPEATKIMDARLLLAGGILLAAIEGRQS